MKNYIMCNLGLHFNVWHRGGGDSEHVSSRTCYVMIGYGDGRTHVFCQLGLEVRWFSPIVHCIGCVLFWTRGNFCLSKYDSV